MCNIGRVCLTAILVIVAALVRPHLANAGIPVIGGPTYDNVNGNGYLTFVRSSEPLLINDSGLALGFVSKYLWPSSLGFRTTAWNAGVLPAELPISGTDLYGNTEVFATGLNNSGIAVGSAQKFDSTGTYIGLAAVRWQVLTNSMIEMPQRAAGVFDTPVGINAQGESVGGRSHWNSSGTGVIALEALPTDTTGTNTSAIAINDSGLAVGFGASTSFADERPLRWDAAGHVTVLDTLGLSLQGTTQSRARAINNAGTAIGFSLKFNAQHDALGTAAVRWDAGGTAVTELGGLGVDQNGVTGSYAFAINTAGTTIGIAYKYDGVGNDLGPRAVRWDPSSTVATELETLTADTNGVTNENPLGINDSGIIVGEARKFFNNNDFDYRAVYWDTTGHVVDLNSLIDPASRWILCSANSISNTGWIVGIGMYDPDGPGGTYPYARLYSLQIPEPSVLATLSYAAILLGKTGRQRGQVIRR